MVLVRVWLGCGCECGLGLGSRRAPLADHHPSPQASHPRVQLVRLAAVLRGGKGGRAGGRRRTALALNASFTPCAEPHMQALCGASALARWGFAPAKGQPFGALGASRAVLEVDGFGYQARR